MDQPQYSNLMAVLAEVPDPRKARGKQLEWWLILGVIAVALLSQQQGGAAIAQWVKEHAATLVAAFRPARGRVPSESTLRRALQRVDVAELERRLATLPSPASLPTPNHGLNGHAVDESVVALLFLYRCPDRSGYRSVRRDDEAL